jgi:Fibronectin type III-like domain
MKTPVGFLGALTLVLSLAVTPGDSAAAGSGGAPVGCPWMNTRLGPDQRARLLLNAGTLDQKLRWLDEQAANSPTQTTFSGVTIDPGSAQHPLSYWNTAVHAWTTDPGTYGVQVGRSSRDLPLSGSFTV